MHRRIEKHSQPVEELDLEKEAKAEVMKAIEMAETIFNRDGEVRPVILTPSRGVMLIPAMANDNDKVTVGKLIGRLSQEGTTMFISEAYLSSPDRRPEDGKYLRPTNDPQRVEAMILKVHPHKEQRTIVIVSEIHRPTGQKPHLGRWSIIVDTKNKEWEIQPPSWKEPVE